MPFFLTATFVYTANLNSSLWGYSNKGTQNVTESSVSLSLDCPGKCADPEARFGFNAPEYSVKDKPLSIRPGQANSCKSPHTIWSTTMSRMKILNAVEQERVPDGLQ